MLETIHHYVVIIGGIIVALVVILTLILVLPKLLKEKNELPIFRKKNQIEDEDDE